MKISLVRTTFTKDSTIGQLYINDEFVCDTLEDIDRGLESTMTLSAILDIKIKGKTAIPTGEYKLINSYSPRFEKYLPLLLNVPGYSGIRIHPGNTALDTEGCLLVGQRDEKNPNRIINSRITFAKVFSLIKKVERKEEIVITITRKS